MYKVLYVEDNPQNFRLVMRMLHTGPYEVHQAPDGLTALEMVFEIKPDLILMDINLPDIDGVEVTRRIRADARGGEIPIIALTANAMIGDRERYLASGMDGYLDKPINREQLLRSLTDHLNSESEGRSLRSA